MPGFVMFKFLIILLQSYKIILKTVMQAVNQRA